MKIEPKKAYHHGNLKNALIESAVEMLREKGVGGLSLREVAKRANVSHAAPYRHFDDKTALLAAVAETGFQQLGDAITQARRDYPDEPRRQLREAGIAYVRLAVQNPEITHLMFGGVLSPSDYPPSLKQVSDQAFQGVLDIVKNGQSAGLYKERDAYDLALAAWSCVHGLAMLVSARQLDVDGSDEDSIRAITERVGEILATGMLRTSGESA